MASITLQVGSEYATGTTVSVYNTVNSVPVAPVGNVVTTAVVGADGTVRFNGLTEGINYLAYAASGTPQYVRFYVPGGVSGGTGSGVPSGGAIDQILTKLSSFDGDATWSDLPISVLENVNTVAAAGSTQTLPDVTVATIHFLTLTSAFCAMTLPTPQVGKSFTVVLKQDAAAGRTAAWPVSVAWPGGVAPVLSSAPGGIDVFSFLSVDGLSWLGFVRSQSSVPVTDPSTISGLQGWWKADVLALADGAKVASWPDSSGNSRTPTQATSALQPVFKTGIKNGLPVVRCAGAQEGLFYSGASGLSGKANYSIFYAYASTRSVTGFSEYLYNAGSPGTDHLISVGLRNVNPGGTDGFTLSQYADDGDINIPNVNTFNTYSVVKTGASGYHLWRNGTSIGTNALPSGTYTPTADQVALFYPGFGSAGGVIGDVGEILVYDSALSTSDRQKVEAYLKAKWATP